MISWLRGRAGRKLARDLLLAKAQARGTAVQPITVHVHLDASMLDEKELIDVVYAGLMRRKARNGGLLNLS